MPQTLVEPPLESWSLPHAAANDRQALRAAANANAQRLGLPTLDRSDRIIASGHQPRLWHPGILAKDIAMRLAAARLDAASLHLIVDQDLHPALNLEIPVRRGDRLDVHHVHLGAENLSVPTGFQPPADAGRIRAALDRIRPPNADRLIDAFTDLPACRSLAEQMAVVLHRLKAPWAGHVPVIFTSDLARMPAFTQQVEAMLHDARACVKAYNRAVAAHPEAGIAGLVEQRELVELPLWALAWQQPRRRVFADLADTQPLLVLESGQPVDNERFSLLPRALLMTGVIRSRCVDFFIHGKGGHLYDRITETWWQAWRGQSLAPRATVSADVYLDFDVPVADRDQLARAQWYHHWLGHNLDRVADVADGLAREKAVLLAHMDDDRDKARRRGAFERLHQINQTLARTHRDLLEQAEHRLARVRTGIANAATVRKRDWCFTFYPPDQLEALVHALAGQATSRR